MIDLINIKISADLRDDPEYMERPEDDVVRAKPNDHAPIGNKLDPPDEAKGTSSVLSDDIDQATQYGENNDCIALIKAKRVRKPRDLSFGEPLGMKATKLIRNDH